MHKTSSLFLVVFFFGCSTEDPETAAPSGQSAQKEDYSHLYDCKADDLQIQRPLSGPGFDPEQGGLLGTPKESYIVHTTQLFVKPEQEELFFELAGNVLGQLGATPGLVGYSLAADATCGDYRTLGVWESEDAIYAFVGSGAHLEAMPRVNEISYTGRTTHWTATADEVNALDWTVADAKIRAADPLPTYD